MIVWAKPGSPECGTIERFVSERIGDDGDGFGQCAALGVVRDGRLIAGVVYHNWRPSAGVIEMSAAAEDRRWLQRPVLRAMFAYPFDEVGCQLVVARHRESATHLRRMWTAAGADEVVIPRLRGRDEGEAVATLTAETWKQGKFANG